MLNKWKVIAFVIITVVAIFYALPNFVSVNVSGLPNDQVNLGLDLRGGSHLLLDVDFDNYISSSMNVLADSVRKNLHESKIGYKYFKVKNNSMQFQLRDDTQLVAAKKLIRQVDYNIYVESKDGYLICKYDNSKLNEILNKVIEQSIEIIRMRVDPNGTKEPIIQRQGDKHILLQMPGEENPESLKSLIGKTAKLTFHLVDETASASATSISHAAPGFMIVKADENEKNQSYLVMRKKPIVSGDHLINAKLSFNQYSQPVVAFEFNKFGSKLFADITKLNTGKRLAIILDKRLLSAPVINEPILGGNGSISGNFTVDSANELALLLRAGALPTSLLVIEERSIGASLGSDSIEDGKKAAIIGFIAVIAFMILSYGILGIFATIALVFALFYMIALLSMFQATLTLPGIAGIILTIGMAVDANVLIYERIKEEIRNTGSNIYAIKVGFDSALGTITDSNITTLIAALLLYIFGVGAIKGFAVTLTIGVISSMFSAIVITKMLIDIWVQYYKPQNLGL